ncbi:hypothetical protein ACFOEY_10005 [Paracandidimonas soli]|uniref:hypothetical protein n=1 Tax=Paracandidimonas soli TaxID=1917182 RepID=UPI0036215484
MDAGLIVRGGGSIVQIDSQYNNLGLRGALTVSLPGGRVTSGSYVGGRTVEASFNWVKGDLLFIRSTTPVHAYYHNMIPGKIVLRQPIDAAAGSAVVYVVGKAPANLYNPAAGLIVRNHITGELIYANNKRHLDVQGLAAVGIDQPAPNLTHSWSVPGGRVYGICNTAAPDCVVDGPTVGLPAGYEALYSPFFDGGASGSVIRSRYLQTWRDMWDLDFPTNPPAISSTVLVADFTGV